MEEEKKIRDIKKVIDKIRPFIQRDGGDVEFVSLVDDIVYVRVHGACIGCSAIDFTLKDGIEALIKDEIDNIKAVELYQEPIL